MKANRIISGVLALTMVFGSFALPAEVSGKAGLGSAISAEAETYEDYEYEEHGDGKVGIIKYFGSDTSVTVPSEINGSKVTSIGEMAFSQCTSLTNVTIPDSVEYIGVMAFSECTNLTSVTIPNNVTSIEDHTFYNCTSLSSVVISNRVKSIGKYAFYGCTSLTKVTIPDSVITIGDSVFHGCTSLTSVTIPDSVKSIGGYAFGYTTDEDKIPSFKIKCYSETAGEEYAKNRDFDYEIITDESDSSDKSDKNLFIYIAAGTAVVLVALGSIIVVKIKKKKNKEQE